MGDGGNSAVIDDVETCRHGTESAACEICVEEERDSIVAETAHSD
jgi:recombinational DNA repair protein RecR